MEAIQRNEEEYEALQGLLEAQALDANGQTRLDRAIGYQVQGATPYSRPVYGI